VLHCDQRWRVQHGADSGRGGAGGATESPNPLATFKLGDPLSYGPHKLAAMVTSYDGEVLATATVIFIYAPAELGKNVPVPSPLVLPQRGSMEPGASGQERGFGKRTRRMVRSFLQHSGLDCTKRAQLVDIPKRDAVIVDVGSYDGHELRSLAAAARKVIAFEATPAKAAKIQELLKEQGIWHKVVLYAAAAGNVSGEVPLHTPLGEGGSEMDSIGSTFYYTSKRNSITVSPPSPSARKPHTHSLCVCVHKQSRTRLVLSGDADAFTPTKNLRAFTLTKLQTPLALGKECSNRRRCERESRAPQGRHPGPLSLSSLPTLLPFPLPLTASIPLVPTSPWQACAIHRDTETQASMSARARAHTHTHTHT
jgi:hypothetical protein